MKCFIVKKINSLWICGYSDLGWWTKYLKKRHKMKVIYQVLFLSKVATFEVLVDIIVVS